MAAKITATLQNAELVILQKPQNKPNLRPQLNLKSKQKNNLSLLKLCCTPVVQTTKLLLPCLKHCRGGGGVSEPLRQSLKHPPPPLAILKPNISHSLPFLKIQDRGVLDKP